METTAQPGGAAWVGHPGQGVIWAVIVVCAVILVAGCTSSTRPKAGAPAKTQAAVHEAELAAALRGMIAGTPQDCVTLSELGTNKAYGPAVIVFNGPAGTWSM